jgi:Uma2 family endonuclease
MPLALTDDSEPEPDVAVVTGNPREYRDAHPTTALLIVEVADATLPYDRERKANLYARAGIADYWIVNLLDRCLEVYRRPTQAGTANARYADRAVLPAETSIAPLATPDKSIAIADLLP